MGNPRTPLTTRSAAEQLGVSQQTVRNWIACGMLPAFVVSGESRPCIRIDQRDVDKFWHENYGQPRTEKQDSKG